MWILIFFLREKRSGHIHQTFTYTETGHIKKKRNEKSVHWILLANCVLLPGPGSWRSMECVGINKITHRNLLTEKFKGLGAWYSGMIFLCRIVLGVSGKDQLEIQLLESKGITLSLIIFYLVYFEETVSWGSQQCPSWFIKTFLSKQLLTGFTNSLSWKDSLMLLTDHYTS